MTTSKTACCDGYGLLELLVALALAGAGLFGFAQMQYQALLTERGQAARIHGLMLFDEIAAHLRAVDHAGDYATAYDDPVQGAPDCRAAPCAPASFARFQVAQWKCRLAGASCADPAAPRPARLMIEITGNAFTLRLQWKDAVGRARTMERKGTWRIMASGMENQ